jgi:hypothetical protein
MSDDKHCEPERDLFIDILEEAVDLIEKALLKLPIERRRQLLAEDIGGIINTTLEQRRRMLLADK